MKQPPPDQRGLEALARALTNSFSHGQYDQVVTEAVARALESLEAGVDTRPLAPDERVERLTEVVAGQLRFVLESLDRGEQYAAAQLGLVNEVLSHLRASQPGIERTLSPVATPAMVLTEIRPSVRPPVGLPETGLVPPWLFTAGRGSPSLLSELRREAAGANSIDILVSFITVSGVRKLIDVLRAVTAANARGEGQAKVRVLTTTYTGATEAAAVEQLAQLNGCEVRVSLDGRRTRLHAKAWIFERNSGFGSAYVGSANLSGAALMGGLEWTVKFTERGHSAMFNMAKAHFETLWADEEFTPYHPADPTSRKALVEALGRERGAFDASPASFFDIHPKPFQREMLEDLAREREAGRMRNLLVAATGTGKTVVAALDYRETVRKLGHRPRLLFVAHRAQILRQARRTYREVLRDHSFGELLTGKSDPTAHEFLFASIDSLTSRSLVEELGADYWHTVVIDECHRLAAARFDQLATTIRPNILLGLTATPERSDGQPIERYFSARPDKRPAVELRLWDALDMQLLAPFEYYACDDETDFSDVPWDRPGESAAIDRLVTGNDLRARLIINEWHRLAANPQQSKAIVYCVSVAHARFMAEQLNHAGIPSACVVGETPIREQLSAPIRLSRGELAALVTVDLYNEGVDIPDVDTLLLLRPTQSPVLFQQQLGRGLRLSPGKESCLILDFVGQHRADFRFDRLLGGITGLSRRELIDAVETGFPGLPPGCHIRLERQTQEQVLKSLRTVTSSTWGRLADELRSYSASRRRDQPVLAEFLHDQRIDIQEIYRAAKPSGWTSLRRKAGVLPGDGSAEEEYLSRRFGDLLHEDDPALLGVIRRVAEEGSDYSPANPADALRAQMLTYQVDSGRTPLSFKEWLAVLDSNPACAEELVQLSETLLARTRLRPAPLPGATDVPLTLHAAYSRREILTAFGFLGPTNRAPHQAGVLPLAKRKLELLLVTLDKSDGFHDRIAYRDYAISPERFHWETQNTAGPETPAGRRYIESGSNGWTFQLFVRAKRENPYRACGPVSIAHPEDVAGNRPMSITWSLEVPLPPRLFSEFSVLRSQA